MSGTASLRSRSDSLGIKKLLEIKKNLRAGSEGHGGGWQQRVCAGEREAASQTSATVGQGEGQRAERTRNRRQTAGGRQATGGRL